LPFVFNHSGTLKIVTGSGATSGLTYYSYNGSAWNLEDFASGLESLEHASPSVFTVGTQYYMLVGDLSGAVQGYILTSALLNSNSSPHKIFKCQTTTISANYSTPANVTSVIAIITERNGTEYNWAMQKINNSAFLLTYGNDNMTDWGNKTIDFQATVGNDSFITETDTYVFVYSDECTGTSIGSYKNTSSRSEFGNYTTPLFSGDKSILETAEQPYLDYWGYGIFVLIMFGMMGVLYIKTQGVAQPLMIAFLWIAALVGSSFIPSPYKVYILFLMAAGIATIFWRLSKSA